MFLAAIIFSFLCFLIDLFFLAGLGLEVKISVSLLLVIIFLLTHRDREAMISAMLTGLLIDLTAPLFPFGVMLGWHFVVYILARQLLASFFGINKMSAIAIFSLLIGALYYAGYYLILFLLDYLPGRSAEFNLWAAAGKTGLSAVAFSLIVLASLAFGARLKRLFARWFLIR
ncbi:MAG: hypothetical protein A3H70_03165 [Candidatus Komeilibacteria bacterium RIFCSPLOWO2_02_FULL_48_11]|uniref:Rod shape-determining protein MreD n=1 Tax=Candidatus Komeilibacteria bacterium RIFCSPLOWO2_02_FULL_48_11 TaxID=1798553 RepID=A0A1G2BUX0_9BACT|nr:MAG: hypothetical protein A3H70_03165 [Candidatus Komeilibacteria bacterium RIFCSPLOWO2_02_FULL_48_11]